MLSWQISLSLCHTLVLYRNKCTYCQTLSTVWYGHESVFFECYRRYKIPRGTPLVGVLNPRGGKNLRFSTEITVYLKNGTR